MLIATRSDRANHRRTLVVAALAAAAGLLAAMTASPAAAADHCADHLVTHAPEGSQGDASAVAITSQAIDEDQAGWIRVSWAAAEGTELSQVIALTVDEETVALAPDAEGFAEDVRSLTFCGSVADQADDEGSGEEGQDGDDEGSGEEGQDGDDEDEVETEPDADDTDDGDDTDERSSGTDDTSDAPTDTSADTQTDTSTDTQTGDPSTDETAGDTGGGSDADEGTTTAYTVEAELPQDDLRDDPEVQVLSVTMSRDDDEADATAAATPTSEGGSGLFGPAAGALVLSVLLALGVLTLADWRRARRNHLEAR
ncbi:MAG: hypothetical protein ACOCT8_05095 [Actinomycetota bacterium]